jgi:hypothetical protein
MAQQMPLPNQRVTAFERVDAKIDLDFAVIEDQK